LQVLHKPVAGSSAQSSSQQTFSASEQKVLWHSLDSAHVAPFAFKPQLPLLSQMFGDTQSESPAQAVVHALEAQMNGSHMVLSGVTQVPLPSQVEAGVAEDAVAQLASLQWVSFS
jgi:hypothetical protein